MPSNKNLSATKLYIVSSDLNFVWTMSTSKGGLKIKNFESQNPRTKNVYWDSKLHQIIR